MVEIVNIVGSGQLSQKIDLTQVNSKIGSPTVSYEPELYPALYIDISEDGPSVTLFSSGKYIIVGSNSYNQLNEARGKFLNLLVEFDEIADASDKWFEIQNVVGTHDLGREIDLNELVLSLGLENAEFDPESFPGIVYRDDENECVSLIFRTGKIVVTGASSKEAVDGAVSTVNKILENESG